MDLPLYEECHSIMLWQTTSQVCFLEQTDVWEALWSQFIINYILETFLGQIKQHSCAVHKCVCYLKYADYSVHLWF